MKKKIFLSVGAMKAGTTWLYSILKHHPSLYFTPEKELHFLSEYYLKSDVLRDEIRIRNVKSKITHSTIKHVGNFRLLSRWCAMYLTKVDSFKWYDRIFSLNKTKKYNCDFSNLSCHIQAEHWKDLSTQYDFKALYILRDPINRLWSHIKFHHQFSGKEMDFHNWSKNDFDKLIQKKFIWENVIYGERIIAMKEGIAAQDLKIVFFEDLVGKPKESINDLIDFLDIEEIELKDEILNKKVNISKSIEMPKNFLDSATELLTPIYDQLKELGYTHPSWMM